VSDGTVVLLVADDLTGANAAAAGFAGAGLRAVTVGRRSPWDGVAAPVTGFDVVVRCVEARHCTAEEAAARTAAAVRAEWPVPLVCNRVDTTLRGNVGATTAAVLRSVTELSGRRAVALCAPAHPAAGRVTVQGAQLLGGRRLEHTELADDPRWPARTSDVSAVVAAQADLRTAHLPVSVVTAGEEALREAMCEALDGGAELVVADALTEEHLHRVAGAAAAAAGEDVTWVSVDPGPASVALARALGLTGHAERRPLLAVCGSATRLTRTQLRRLTSERAVSVVRAVVEDDRPVPDVESTASRLAAALDEADPGQTVLLTTVLDHDDVRPVSAAVAGRLPVALARATGSALAQHAVDGLFSTGGDVTAALLTELGAVGLEAVGEVVPLAVAGTLEGGPHAGLPVVTKGGLVGGPETVLDCLDHLRRAADLRRHRVRAAAPVPPPT
jgi:D-threonate/D-erythronate kinase